MSDKKFAPDDAAIFACAASLNQEYNTEQRKEELVSVFDNTEKFYRYIMQVAGLFEAWACKHVVFDQVYAEWPCFLWCEFGKACAKRMTMKQLSEGFNAEMCMRVTMDMRLPLWYTPGLPLWLEFTNLVKGSGFKSWLLATTRTKTGSKEVERFIYGDSFDPSYDASVISLYGVDENGVQEHIADSCSYPQAQRLLINLCPGLDIPTRPVTVCLS